MTITWLDWLIIAASLVVCFVPALYYGKHASKDLTQFFVSGRSVPWWLAGISMVATTFSTGTPLLVTDIVRRQGVAGNWAWWAFALTGVATIFFFAQLWRRSGVMTDLEYYELRYSGRAAGAVRGFRAVYLGLFFNVLVMASVNLAACKIGGILFGFTMWETLAVSGVLSVVFAAHSGLWGVLIIDLIQLGFMMAAVIAAAYFAVQAPVVGGLAGLVEKVSAMPGPNGLNYLDFLPDFSNQWTIAVAVFIMPIAVQWWAVWYPGAEPGGGSFIAQRMLASKSERDSLGAVLLFNFGHYVLRPWPWIITALASLVVFPTLADIQREFPRVDPGLVNHDIAYAAMMKFLPAGFLGLMIAGMIAAHSSTILTLLNWGGSYLVHDCYRRFLRPGASERHYIVVARVATVLLFVLSCLLTMMLESAKGNFDIILQVGAGTGLLYLLRWYWWRITAWCEIAAMVSSFAISVVFFVFEKQGGPVFSTDQKLLLTVAFTTLCWVATAYLGPATDPATLVEFYRRVRPPGPGWTAVRRLAGLDTAGEAAPGDNIPLALAGWTLGCAVIWAALFAVGSFCYGRIGTALALTAVFAVTGIGLLWVLRQLWKTEA
ncbi:MAG: Na+:solute symporter [Verrucomicrobia bacterium]|nr:Na+:solute symporter [Verrucomicrobiota bacterium]